MHFSPQSLNGLTPQITALENDAVMFRNEIANIKSKISANQVVIDEVQAAYEQSDIWYDTPAARAARKENPILKAQIPEYKFKLASIEGTIITMSLEAQRTIEQSQAVARSQTASQAAAQAATQAAAQQAAAQQAAAQQAATAAAEQAGAARTADEQAAAQTAANQAAAQQAAADTAAQQAAAREEAMRAAMREQGFAQQKVVTDALEAAVREAAQASKANQVPEAPLPVSLPPIPTLQPAGQVRPASTAMPPPEKKQSVWPWVIAAATAFLM